MKINSIGAFVISFLTSLIMTSCNQTKTTILIDAKEVLSKKEEEVIELLGKPDSTYYIPMLNKKIFTQLYYKGTYDIEVRYSKDRSESILINRNNDLPFSKEALVTLGIEGIGEPDSCKPNLYLTWNNNRGFEKINIYSTYLAEDGTVEEFKVYVKKK